LAWSNTIQYTPSYSQIHQIENSDISLKESTKLFPESPIKTGVNWGKCGPVKQGFYLYLKNSAAPVELRTFTSVKSTFASQADMWDKQGITLTGKVRPTKQTQPLDVDFQFSSNSLLSPQKVGVETTVKIKY
jgi:hypothetical protein